MTAEAPCRREMLQTTISIVRKPVSRDPHSPRTLDPWYLCIDQSLTPKFYISYFSMRRASWMSLMRVHAASIRMTGFCLPLGCLMWRPLCFRIHTDICIGLAIFRLFAQMESVPVTSIARQPDLSCLLRLALAC